MKALNRLFSDIITLADEALRRLLELPAIGVAMALVVAVSLLFALLWLWRRRKGATRTLARAYLLSVFAVGLISFALLLDQKLAGMLSEVRALDSAFRVGVSPDATRAPRGGDGARLIHANQVRRGLRSLFGEVELSVSAINEAMDYAALRIGGTRPVVAFLSVVDLSHPKVSIAITPQQGPKSLTSDFAKSERCAVAINGEAGITPMPTARLGVWTGNWIVHGNPIQMTDSAQRPFLSFDAESRATYSVASVVDREPGPEKYNTLWGRFDLLVGGEIVRHAQQRNTMRAPRTLMATDPAGQTLFLMVIDGRQLGYSEGLSLEDSARLLRTFGASDGMSCDEGGSTAMYLHSRHGLVNRPSAGFERPTYTHFGVRFTD